jgi:hypothetical protein
VAIELTDDQRREIEMLAGEKDERCPNCGSFDLRCGDRARPTFGNYQLDLWCRNEAAHPDGAGSLHYFTITNEEAQRIGLRN